MKHLNNNFILCARFGDDLELKPIGSFCFLPTASLVYSVSCDFKSLYPDCGMHHIIQVLDYSHYKAARLGMPFRVLFNVDIDSYSDEAL